MTIAKEKVCLKALQQICEANFPQDEYSLNGAKECAVCLEKTINGWTVYEKEKNSRNDTYLYDNVIDASMDLLKRLSTASKYSELKNIYYNAIISKTLEPIRRVKKQKKIAVM